ncbi:Pick C1 protein [Seminavis robusta]|uniref:Pick C1 protein n=1 Tax=Seminavis robusta TaxID=568900 RepID=A0A9N8HIP0_9STRA|nr:Pick C1 protein [Seminavis robusta]|eukprot:Sro607_g174640.1 Pick C1 protein (1073) ;mRNA; r:23129-26541
MTDVAEIGSKANDTPPMAVMTSDNDDEVSTSRRRNVCCWMKVTRWVQVLITHCVVTMSMHAASHPFIYVTVLPTLSFTIAGIGLMTNFHLELDIEAVLSPAGSQPAIHKEWVESPDGFPYQTREVALLMHRNGDNVLYMNAMERVFTAVHTVLTTDGYDDLCQQGAYINFDGDKTCRFMSVTGFFDDHSVDAYQEQIQTDQQLQEALSAHKFASGSPVYHDAILGNWIRNNSNDTITFAQSFLVVFFLPDLDDDANAFEEKVFERLDVLRLEWEQDDILTMAMLSIHATQMEYQRAIYGDLYLIGVVAVIMCSFVGITFASYGYGHPTSQSRTLLGAMSVYTITMSWLAGCGVMFVCGVPFTPITQILPFCVFGIGLDDTFIIVGSYLRQDHGLEILPRIRKTMEEVSHAISLTTITTVFAFLLGLRSGLPGVRWMCLYAAVTIAVDFIFQVTMFVSFIALDERRIQEHRRDICVWIIDHPEDQDEDFVMIDSQQDQQQQQVVLKHQETQLGDTTASTGSNTTEQVDATVTTTPPIMSMSVSYDDEDVRNKTDDDDEEEVDVDDFGEQQRRESANLETSVSHEIIAEGTYDDDDVDNVMIHANVPIDDTTTSVPSNAIMDEKPADEEPTKQALMMESTSLVPEDAKAPPPQEQHDGPVERQLGIPERIMSRYADLILRPCGKAVVLLLFAAFTAACAYSCTLLEQEFKVGDFVPTDSYLKDVVADIQTYASVVRPIGVYFRDVDQSDPEIQEQMVKYVNDLESLPELNTLEFDIAGQTDGQQTGQVTPFCWVRDFKEMEDELIASAPSLKFVIQNLTFTEQLNLALNNPTLREVYGQDIIRDDDGNIVASRCWLFLTEIDLNEVEDQVDLLHDQRAVGAAQPINQDKAKGEWPFFFYDLSLFYWEAYDIAIQELISTIVSGALALAVISFLLIPHWTAALFVTPMILVLYCNFLGTLQFFGLHINPIFFFVVLVSIGLLVDFLLHVLMRYYDTIVESPNMTRNERVKVTLVTMGSSIMLGGLTTFLGVVPLCLSTTKIFMIVFKGFFAMVVLGLAHGLILFPVILSLVGPNA